VTERIRHVPDFLDGAIVGRDRVAEEQIADGGFPSYQKLVGENVPGPERELALDGKPSKPVSLFRTRGKEILQEERLAVQNEMSKRGLALQRVEDLSHDPHEVHAELMIREVPFAIPVGV